MSNVVSIPNINTLFFKISSYLNSFFTHRNYIYCVYKFSVEMIGKLFQREHNYSYHKKL